MNSADRAEGFPPAQADYAAMRSRLLRALPPLRGMPPGLCWEPALICHRSRLSENPVDARSDPLHWATIRVMSSCCS
jgi:hypothetical protein